MILLFFTVEIRNSANETPYDVAVRYAQLACVKILGGDDLDSDSNSTVFSDDDDAPLHGLAGESCDSRGLVFDEQAKKASRGKISNLSEKSFYFTSNRNHSLKFGCMNTLKSSGFRHFTH